MAQNQGDGGAQRPANPLRLSQEAYQNDDVASMEEAISLTTAPGRQRFSTQQIVDKGVRGSIKHRATNVLKYLLDNQKVDVGRISANTIMAFLDETGDWQIKPPYEVLDILLQHGWDIDTRFPQRTDWPLLWYATNDPKLLDWCLDHGASVYIPGDTPPRDKNGIGAVPRMTILERAADDGTVATVEKLTAKGCPLADKALHRAVYRATLVAPKSEDDDRGPYEERLAMVRHLVDVVGLDVNADCGVFNMPSRTPLWNVAAHHNRSARTRDLVWLLLDRGADPRRKAQGVSALEEAEASKNTQFVEAVKEWEAKKEGVSK